jgi:hypothetical protein
MTAFDEEQNIPGYDYGRPGSAVSPLTEEEVRLVEQTVGWTQADADLLQRHADLFRQHADAMATSWRMTIASLPQLAKWFVDPQGKPDEDYKVRVRPRLARWVVDVATRPHDRDWINYQEEIGLRHTPAKKNKADNKQTPPLIPLRYLLGFVPVVLQLQPFFAGQVSDKELASLEKAWTKAVLLHVTLWARPYTAENLW